MRMMSIFTTQAQAWYQTPISHWVHIQEKECLEPLWANCFGYYLLELSFSPHVNLLTQGSRIRHHIELSPNPTQITPRTLIGDFNLIPLASESVDLVLVHHWLGLYSDPLECLSEIYRVLMPEGRIIICGIRPAGVWKFADQCRNQAQFPWSMRSASPERVLKWLQSTGFSTSDKVLHHSYGLSLYRNNERAAPSNTSYKAGLKMGGGYVIEAVKRVNTLTPMRLTWSKQPSWSDYIKPIINK